jgi:hypothetical protein
MLPIVSLEPDDLEGSQMAESEQQQGAESSAAIEHAAASLSLAEEPSTFVVVLEGGESDA